MRPPDKGAALRVPEWNRPLNIGHRRGRLAVAMYCNWVFVEHGRDSEQMGSDPSSAIGQIAVEVDQLAVGAFCDLILLSVEVALSMDY